MIKHLLDKLFLKRVIIWLLLVVLLIITVTLKFSHDFLITFSTILHTDAGVLKGVNDEVFSFLMPLILFGFIYQVFTEKENREIARKDIIDSIQSDSDTLALFSAEAKMGFVKNMICSIIGDRYGNLLYNNMIEKYLEGKIAYRENFKYDVELNISSKDFTFKGITVLSKDSYYSLEQNLVYTKHLNKEIKDVDFKIVFAFDNRSLDHWMNEEFVFFREVLKIEDWENDISNYTASDFEEFVEKCLGLKFKFLDNNDTIIASEIHYKVNYINTGNVKGLEIVLKDKQLLKNICIKGKHSTYYRCGVSFNMPYNKKTTRFHFALPEPTLNPSFTIRFDRSFKNIDFFTHFSNTEKKEKVKIDPNGLKYSISTFDIIYPRSGVIFFWDL